MPNFLGDFVSGLGYAASNVAGRNIQLTPGGLGAKISGSNNPSYQQVQSYANQNNVLGASTGPVAPYGPFVPPKPQAVQQTGGGNIPSTSQSIPSNNFNQGLQNMNQQASEGNSFIDQDYEIAMGALAGQEQALQGQANTAIGTIGNEAAATRTQLGQEQATKEQSAQSSLSNAETQGKTAMQQARDVFRQTQQTNTAQLSALGISSSSVSEALAERLGVETARRIAGITGSIDEVRQNTTQELGRIKNYYAEKSTQIQEWAANEKAKIQNSLVQGLNQINSARQQAASDKAKARSNLLSQVQNQIFSLTQQQQQFDQSLQQWAAQKAEALTPIAQDPNYLNNLIAQSQKLNQQFSTTGFAFTPEVAYDKLGQVTGKISSQKKPDELANPFGSTVQ